MTSILQDIRLTFRIFRRTPVPTGIALLSIALSVGATAVVFAAIKSVLIDPLPYAHAEELVQLRSDFPQMQRQANSDWVVWNDTRELDRRTRTLESTGVYSNAIFDLAGDSNSTPEALYGARITANLFPVLGVSPMFGRNILPEEDQPGHTDVMILSYGLWVRRFNSDRSIVGRSVTVNGHACQVIGVMPPDFDFPLRRQAAHTPSPYRDFWAAPFNVPTNPNAALGAVSRLRPGVTLTEARQDLASISGALAHDFPETNRDLSIPSRLPDRRLEPRKPYRLGAGAAWIVTADLNGRLRTLRRLQQASRRKAPQSAPALSDLHPWEQWRDSIRIRLSPDHPVTVASYRYIRVLQALSKSQK